MKEYFIPESFDKWAKQDSLQAPPDPVGVPSHMFFSPRRIRYEALVGVLGKNCELRVVSDWYFQQEMESRVKNSKDIHEKLEALEWLEKLKTAKQQIGAL